MSVQSDSKFPVNEILSLRSSNLGEDTLDGPLERRAVRKLDYTILPIMAMFYMLAFLDRANIANARVAGLQKDLAMTDWQYQIAIMVLFVPYMCSELPGNLLLRRIGPRILMPSLLTLWGVVVVAQGFVTSYEGLTTIRALLGLFEGPLFPSIVLYLSGFYKRNELSLRVALFSCTAALSGAFSGLLAAAIEKMDGLGGKPGWTWIFVIEGLFTILMGISGFFLVPSTPRDSKFLTEAEKDIIMRRLEKDRPSINTLDAFSFKQLLLSLQSPHVVILAIAYFLFGTIGYGLALFIPSILNELGFSQAKSQLLSAGPFATAAVLIVAFLSDHYKTRTIPILAVSCLSLAGFTVFLKSDDKFLLYGALYLMVPGIFSVGPVYVTWMANNSEPHYRRATSTGIGVIVGNAGGILTTWRYPQSEAPRYRKTAIMNLTFVVFMIVLTILNYVVLSWKNKDKQLRRTQLLEKYADEKEVDGGLKAWHELGDRHPDFHYVT